MLAGMCVCFRVCVRVLYHSSLYQRVYICRFVFLRHFPVLVSWENHGLKRPLGSCPPPLSLLAATTAAGHCAVHPGSGSPSLLLFDFFSHFFLPLFFPFKTAFSPILSNTSLSSFIQCTSTDLTTFFSTFLFLSHNILHAFFLHFLPSSQRLSSLLGHPVERA